MKHEATKITYHDDGFSILELLISMAIIAIIAAAVGINLVNYYRATALEAASKDIVGELRLAQNRALMSQDGDSNNQGDKWGIRFTNGADDYYETFYGNTYSTASTTQKIYLPPAVVFTLPASSSYTDVIFTNITGTTTATSTVISSADGSKSQTINIEASGRVNAN